MAGSIKHMQRSHRSYGQKDAAFRGFHVSANSSKYYREQRKSLADHIASFMALLKLAQQRKSK